MNIALIVLLAFFAVPVFASLVASVRERGEDGAFASEKIAFRS